jgi:hypothetical protein
MRTLRRRLPAPVLILSCAALFAALGGSTYAATSSGRGLRFQKLQLINGWSGCCQGGTPGYAEDSSRVVHLRGALHNGSGNAFVLPKGARPAHHMYIMIYTSLGQVGYLYFTPSGDVAPAGDYAGGYTSLNGVSFVAGQ